MSICYLGAFPPGYGGVTIKNQNLFSALEKAVTIEKVDFNKIKRKNLKELVRFLVHLFNPSHTFVVGVSGKKTRKRLTRILYYFNRKAMNRSIIMVMGGTAAHDMATDPEYRKCAMGYKRIYVETKGMYDELVSAGFMNAAIYPNGRFRPATSYTATRSEGRLKCVFFSLVQPEKGVDLLLEAARILPRVSFHIYGKVVQEYMADFCNSVSSLENVSYEGVFAGTIEDVYAELHKYDVLLFPTKWDIEGVPGILVEAKITGLACIVSNKSYNSDLVEDGVDGIVLKDNTTEMLVEAILDLDSHRDKLFKLKQEGIKSSEKYYIENYIDSIVECISGA